MGESKGFPGFTNVFQSFNEAFGEAAKRPLIGLTQGGSSRRGGGAKPAANNGLKHTTKQEVKKHGA